MNESPEMASLGDAEKPGGFEAELERSKRRKMALERSAEVKPCRKSDFLAQLSHKSARDLVSYRAQ